MNPSPLSGTAYLPIALTQRCVHCYFRFFIRSSFCCAPESCSDTVSTETILFGIGGFYSSRRVTHSSAWTIPCCWTRWVYLSLSLRNSSQWIIDCVCSHIYKSGSTNAEKQNTGIRRFLILILLLFTCFGLIFVLLFFLCVYIYLINIPVGGFAVFVNLLTADAHKGKLLCYGVQLRYIPSRPGTDFLLPPFYVWCTGCRR